MRLLPRRRSPHADSTHRALNTTTAAAAAVTRHVEKLYAGLYGSHLPPNVTSRVITDDVADEIQQSLSLKREMKFTKPADADLGAHLITYHGSVYVLEVAKHTRAWQLGLQPGDKIVQVNEMMLSEGCRIEGAIVWDILKKSSMCDLAVLDQAVNPKKLRAHYQRIASGERQLRRASAPAAFGHGSTVQGSSRQRSASASQRYERSTVFLP
eukprot:comp20968_c0_seq1/m.28062 comp20968_c0_seq1/g.28062  ORF comp20968_c0_seq1/g.28062 comp20968_c0_seq1/m.28062 type:complete len:211 (-) comp20968_c0_seq1:326-958(-)